MIHIRTALLIVSILFLTLFSCAKSDAEDSEVDGVSAEEGAFSESQIWQVENEWDKKWEEGYSKWITDNLSTSPSEDGESSVTKMYLDYVKPIEKIIVKNKKLKKYHLDCADNVIFFRALYAKMNKLPFMLRVPPYGKSNKWWFVGHFGFRDGDDYHKTAESDIKFSYTKYSNLEERFAMFIYDVSVYFGVASFSSSVGSSGDVYDIEPKTLRVGDFYIQSEYGRGGHSVTFGKIDFGEVPFLTGYSYNEFQSLLFLINDEFNRMKGAGLKRWKWAVKAEAKDGELIWKNKVQEGDTPYKASFDGENYEIGEPNRKEIFRSGVIKEVESHGSSIDDIILESVKTVKKSIVHLANNPSSCNTRIRMPKLIDNIWDYTEMVEDFPEEAETLNHLWSILTDLFPAPSAYEASALCGWNSSHLQIFARILFTNRDFLETEFEKQQSNDPYFPILKVEDVFSYLGLSDELAKLDQSELIADITLAKLTKKHTPNSMPSPTPLCVNCDNDNEGNADLLLMNPASTSSSIDYYPFSHENICMFAPNTETNNYKWMADEAWLIEKKELWPTCYQTK